MKEKRVEKTKEELKAEMEAIAEAQRLRRKVKEEFYPFLCLKTNNIDEAKIFSQALSVAIEQSFTNLQKTMKVKDLGLVAKLTNNEQSAKWKEVLEMFAEENIMSAQRILRDMPNAIDSFIREEMTKRPLSSLKVDFLD
jgi:hypothetical protein